MKIAVLGLGVIGTTYAYVFQKAGHEVFHIVREIKKNTVQKEIKVHILDGRYTKKGEEKDDFYSVSLAQVETEFDYILISVARGKLAEAVKTIRDNHLKGTLILFCNFWSERKDIENIIGDYPYITAFPTAGGHMEDGILNTVLFDHIMLESKSKCNIPNYEGLILMLQSADIKQEIPHDMFDWIWIHMAINAGVTSTAARDGDISNPNLLVRNLMGDSKMLAQAVKCIRETLKVVSSRGVDLKLYRNEILPYKIPAGLAGIIMKKLFSSNELTSRIMTLHNDVNDIMYGCRCIYDEGKKRNLKLPLFYENMDKIMERI